MDRIQKTGSLPSLVVSEVRRMAREGSLEAGARLPTEEEMVERLGVGRSSVREAVRVLEFLGLVEVVQGRGTFLLATPDRLPLEPVRWWLSDPELYTQVLEARLSIEPAIARLTALRADAAFIDRMEKTIEQDLEDQAAGCTTNPHLTVEFHQLCADACGNLVFRMLFKGINDLLKELVQTVPRPPELHEGTLCYHRQLVDAFRARDADTAEAVMRQHLLGVQEASDAFRKTDGAENRPGKGGPA